MKLAVRMQQNCVVAVNSKTSLKDATHHHMCTRRSFYTCSGSTAYILKQSNYAVKFCFCFYHPNLYSLANSLATHPPLWFYPTLIQRRGRRWRWHRFVEWQHAAAFHHLWHCTPLRRCTGTMRVTEAHSAAQRRNKLNAIVCTSTERFYGKALRGWATAL